RTVAVTSELSEKVRQLPGVEVATMVNGFSLIGGEGSNYGLGFVKLAPWDEREDDDMSAEAIIGKLFVLGAGIADAEILFFQPPSVAGFRVSSGFEMQILDRSGGSFNDLDAAAQGYLMDLMARPEILYASTSFNTNYPQYEIDLNVPKAKEAGVSISSIFSTLQGYIGSVYAADF